MSNEEKPIRPIRVIRVIIIYTDGNYYMQLPSCDNPEWVEANSVEIPFEVWENYQTHMDRDHQWHQYMLRLSNEIYERKESK